ncbi:MAG: glutamine synthetase family protein [Parcubacteria group bacterium]
MTRRIPRDLLTQIEGVGVFKLMFSDVLGRAGEMDITAGEINTVLQWGQGFDGSSIRGFARIEESDLMAHPDFRTFRVLPPSITNGIRTGVFFCDIKTPTGRPYPGDSRHCLRRALERIAGLGYTFYTGPECEFFIFLGGEGTQVIDHRGYFEAPGHNLMSRMVTALQETGIAVECSHHEVAPSQYEIDLRYQDALMMADQVMLYRWLLKRIAEPDFHVTFMPKPIYGVNGSGMHVHQSLFAGERNLFFDRRYPLHLSRMARQYIAGLLTHVREFTLVTNQLVNSYKRIVPNYEAPCYVAWGQRNRSSLVRVPRYRVGKEKAVRIELRSPDPACNPYLAFAVMLGAGMKGIEERYRLVDPVEQDIFHMDTRRRTRLGIEMLPASLLEAIQLAEGSPLLHEVLGDHILSALLANKRKEWDAYRTWVTDYEVANTLHMY